MTNQQIEKFAAMIHDKANKGLKKVLMADAENESQAAAFLSAGADKMGYELTDGHVYRMAEVPPSPSLGVVEYRSPLPRPPIRDTKKAEKPEG